MTAMKKKALREESKIAPTVDCWTVRAQVPAVRMSSERYLPS